MNNYSKTLLIILSIFVVGMLVWYFYNIVTYILISVVLSLLGQPIVHLLSKIKIGKIRIPIAVSAAIALVSLWAVLFCIIWLIIPVIAAEAKQISEIDTELISSAFNEPLQILENKIASFISTDENFSLQQYITEKMVSLLSVSQVSNILNIITKLFGNIFVAFFTISFVTFFFLKDSGLFLKSILVLTPTKSERAVKRVILLIRRMLLRYFLGLCIDVTIVFILVTIGMLIVGLTLEQALVIGIFAGLLNMIPYVGPIIAIIFGLSFVTATHLNIDIYNELFPVLGYMFLVFVVVQIIDGILIQPFIYSNSVKAHPLEIFLVILIAGSLAGITGMLLAIPSYTIIRVIAREFFINFKVVQKLTEGISDI
ncbi:MAG: hypothetical protein A2046_13495 [Bacteroidetes bacterium GWA2_30_7]|nr:MAG: hypothetical protein A2046_13495 [Bacteroidetes bacterium GWA2_30_7]